MKATVPQSALPTQMAADNRLTTIYTTHVLIPKLGPLASQRYTRLYARLLRDYSAAVELVRLARQYRETYRKPVAIPAPPPKGNARDFRFEPAVKGGNPYRKHYLAGLVPFAGARIAEPTEVSPVTAASSSPARKRVAAKRAAGGSAVSAPLQAPSDAGLARFDAAGIWPPEVKALLSDDPRLAVSGDGRVVILPIEPQQLLGNHQNVARGKKWVKEKVPRETVGGEAKGAAAGYALATILHGLAQPNVVIEEMLLLGMVNATGKWLGPELEEAPDVTQLLARRLAAHAGAAASAREQELRVLIDRGVLLLHELGVTNSVLIERVKGDAKIRADVYRYVGWKVDQVGAIDPGRAPLPDDTVIVGSREWAFRRTERLSIAVGTPTLRGPFAAEAVAPASKLVLSESSLQEVVTFREQGSGSTRARVSETATFSAATFRQALSHMAEEGINSEGAFQQDTTLFDSLRERRREAVERTLTQISTNNEQRSGVVARTVTSTARSYTTRGKDPHFATTEVSFQVAAPVDVEVRLEDVGLVWCPRMRSPFIALHRLITDFEDEARREYRTQNQVVDPVRPPEVFETATFKNEVGVRGNVASQAVSFSFEVPAGYLDWELDAAATSVNFRNGTSADYNWDEQWNWDDLETWHAFIRSISRTGNTISGTAVLETTDPEWLNRGFLTFEIAMQRLTDETRVAIEAYEADRQEAAAQRQAVEVRARQYARLRRDELIEQYEGSYALQDEAFANLIKQVFQGGNPDHVSYWREIVHSCIEWSSAAMRFEPGRIDSLAFPHLPPSHFMNAVGIRFILPVLRSAETAFFDALGTGAGTYHQIAAAKVRGFVDNYRNRVDELKESDPDDDLVLDAYKSELVLGRHLEAVLSEHPFAEPT